MDFTILKTTDCTKYIEKKGKFSYLSWPYMVEQLRTHVPLATIQARKSSTGLPYFKDDSGAMVETYIMEGETELWSEWLPVMNFKNQSITNPDSMDVNKAVQRCKAKCISEYLGIGLYIYMGEDLPEKSDGESNVDLMTKAQSDKLIALCEKNKLDPKKIAEEYNVTKTMKAESFDITFKIIESHIKSGDIGFDLTKGVKL